MQAPRVHNGLSIATRAGFAIALLWACVTVWIAWQSQWEGPFRDLWELLPQLESTFNGSWHWQDFWAPYGGAHRLVIPQLLFVADMHWLAGSNRLPLAVALACQLLILGLAVWQVRRCYPGNATMAWLAASLCLVTLFSATQLYNLNYSISCQWFLATAASASALFLASQPVTPRQSVPRILALVVVGILASLSNSAGILLWPVVAWILWLRRYPLPHLLALMLAGSGMIGLYLYRMHAGLPAPPHDSLASWLLGMGFYSLVFVTGYLASPLSRHWPAVASLIALVVWFALLLDGWRQRYRPQSDAALRLMVAGMALHTALIAFTAGLGRTMYPGMQTTERYQTGALFFWLAAALAALAWAQRRGGSWRLLLPLPVLLTALAADYNTSARKHLALANLVHQTHTGIALGLTDMPVAINTISYPAGRQGDNYVAWHAGFLQAHRIGPWANPWLAWQGKTLPAMTPAYDCRFTTQTGEAVNAAGARPVTVSGSCHGKAPETVLLTDPQLRVIGMAHKALPAWPRLAAAELRWLGYTTQAVPNPIIAYPVSRQPGITP